MAKKLESAFTDDMFECYECGSYDWIEIHHIFGGCNRKHSEEYGYVLPLCHRCHNEPPKGVHHNKASAANISAWRRSISRSTTRGRSSC